MAFEWDPAKNEASLEKHGIRFEEAREIFSGVTLTRLDHRHVEEVREISIGTVRCAVVIVVVHTDRSGVTRIISARKANTAEREAFRRHLERAGSRDSEHS